MSTAVVVLTNNIVVAAAAAVLTPKKLNLKNVVIKTLPTDTTYTYEDVLVLITTSLFFHEEK